MSRLEQDQVLELFSSLSNRGRWGDGDQMGTLNYITPAKRVAAAGEVQLGLAVPIGRELATGAAPGRRPAVLHQMHYYGPDPISCGDSLWLNTHGMATTHLDALGHEFFAGHAYNGRERDSIVQATGLSFGDIMALEQGVFTRAVLLDLPRAMDVDWLSPGHRITPQELAECASRQQVDLESGDALLVRSGHDRWLAAGSPGGPTEERSGLGTECLPWLQGHEVALYAGDCIEQLPSPYPLVPFPLHQIGIAAMGLVLLDSVELEQLAATCAGLGRYTCLLTCAPLRLRGGTGSPLNPICLF